MVWILLLAFLYLSPALSAGPAFGPADLGRQLSVLTETVPPPPVHSVADGDVITQSVPWNTLDWEQVHAGHLPLWNDLSGTGLPQFLNWESAPLALPTLAGYLAPLPAAFLVTVAVKLLLAGWGTYLLVRLLGARPLGAALAGTVFMLSGSLTGWLGTAVSGPLVWTGWIAAGALLAYRRPGCARVGLLGLAVAFSVYGGFPEASLLLALGLATAAAGAGVARLVAREAIRWRGVIRVAGGGLFGVALSAPLWLPGLQLLRGAVRSVTAMVGLPTSAGALVVAQGYDGLPLHGDTFFGTGAYVESAAYVGVVALALALLAVLLHWRRPVVVGLAVAALVTVLVVYQLGPASPVQHLLRLAHLAAVAPQRMLPVLAFAVAVLAGLGADTVLGVGAGAVSGQRLVRASASVVTLLAAVLALLWVWRAPGAPAGTPPGAAPAVERHAALVWPTAELAALAAVLVLVTLGWRSLARPAPRAGRLLGTVLVLGLLLDSSAYLLAAGTPINTYGRTDYPVSPAVTRLQRLVGTRLVALDAGNASCPQPQPVACGVRAWFGVGLYPLMNIPYGIRELALHDPAAPRAYFDSWPVPNSQRRSAGNLNLFAPDVDTAALARRYGAAYVLALPSLPAPAGTVRVARVGQLTLYRVPGARRFGFLGASPRDRVLSVRHRAPGSYALRVRVAVPERLALRVTAVPGWHVAVDGRAVAARRLNGTFLSIRAPRGARVVTLTYWPARLTDALLLAAAALVCFAGSGLLLHRRQNQRLRVA